MSWTQAFWHLVNLVLPGVMVAALLASFMTLIWRREMRRPWWVLTLAGSLVGVGVLVGGVLITGHDGRMATYAALVLGVAAAEAWVAWR